MTDDRIEEAIKRENAKLCIFDLIQAYLGGLGAVEILDPHGEIAQALDRKSTRLNSSHAR